MLYQLAPTSIHKLFWSELINDHSPGDQGFLLQATLPAQKNGAKRWSWRILRLIGSQTESQLIWSSGQQYHHYIHYGPAQVDKGGMLINVLSFLPAQSMETVQKSQKFLTSNSNSKSSRDGGLKELLFFHMYILVGGFNPFEKYWSKWESSPNSGENKKYWKPSPRYLETYNHYLRSLTKCLLKKVAKYFLKSYMAQFQCIA